MGGGAAATAAGATAVAGAGLSKALLVMQGLGTAASVVGNLQAARQAEDAGNYQAAQIAAQAETERNLTAVKDSRARVQMAGQIAQQRAELAARGVQLDSPTALALGESAARELSFESQTIRNTGAARNTELGAEARLVQLRAAGAAMSGRISAIDSLMRAPTDLWKGFNRNGGAK